MLKPIYVVLWKAEGEQGFKWFELQSSQLCAFVEERRIADMYAEMRWTVSYMTFWTKLTEPAEIEAFITLHFEDFRTADSATVYKGKKKR